MNRMQSTIRFTQWAVLLLMLVAIPSAGLSQFLLSPQPGDVYKEFARVMTGDDWRVTDPNINLSVYPAAAPFLPNPTLSLSVDDLSGATRAEAVINIWGGHVGTSGKKIRFNGNSWIDIPEFGAGNGIPGGHDGFNYITQADYVISVPVGNLVQGNNTFQGTNSGQSGPYGFGWGQFGWYSIIIRVYYDGSKPHSTGSITSLSTGGTFGENPSVAASVNGGSDRVDFLAYYDGYDTDGDGVFQEYHHDYAPTGSESTPTIKNHVGTATGGSSQVTWNTQYVPDQGGIKLLARIRNGNGVWYVSPEVTGLTLQRSGSYVRLYKPLDTPERAWARGDIGEIRIHGDIPGGDNVANATEAVGFVRTWNGIDGAQEPTDYNYRKFNNWTDGAYGGNHAYSFNIRSLPVSELRSGSNEFTFYSSNILHHGIEILWPGPGLIVRYGGGSPNVGPSITTHPSNQSVTVGGTATFNVGATGTPTLSYQWQKNGSDIGSAIGTSYTTPPAVIGDNGATFRCVVKNDYGTANSNTATLTVGSPTAPSIDTHPADQTVQAGQTATFSVVASGTSPLSYRWQKNNVDIDGAISDSYTTPATVKADSGATFRCRVTNSVNTATSNSAMLHVTSTAAPLITGHPADQTVNLGQTASFSVTASGTGTLTYLWQKNSVNIGGAINASYTTPATVMADSGALFRCVVTNASGSTNSNAARLTVVAPTSPVITQNPVDQLVGVGQTATFTVGAMGAGTLMYQWQKNSVNIDGAISSSHTTPATALADSGTLYRCVVTNSSAGATSTNGILKVTTGSVSILSNSGFERGTESWAFYTNGSGAFTTVPAGLNNPHAARINITQEGTNVQLYQSGVTLEAGAEYLLYYRGYSSSGHDVSMSVQKHTTPFSSYGLLGQVFNLDTSWKDLSIQFTASGFTGVATDSRVMFYLAPYDSANDNFYMDDVVLAKPGSVAPPGVATHPANASASAGQTATFAVVASGTPPFSYQWQKNGVDIKGGTSALYTTPAAAAGDNGATFKCIVKNPVGNATSNTAALSVVPGGSFVAPTLVSPADGATGVPTSTILRWTNIPEATQYHIQLSTDSGFAGGFVLNDSTKTDTSSAVTGLSNSTNYYWKVKAKGALGSTPFSAARKFKTVLILPAAVTLVSPANGITIVATTQRFTWNKSTPGVTRYWFELAADSLFLTQRTVDSTRTDTTKDVLSLTNGISHWWKVRAANADGWGPFSEVRRLRVQTNGVEETGQTPASFALDQNYPNPFNPSTTIRYALPAASNVLLIVITPLGDEVTQLVNSFQDAGYHQVRFDAANLASGVYFYRIVAGEFSRTKKLLLVR